LTEIVVEDLGVIERAEVVFEAGGTALTGETGAGKTLVVAALGLLLGDRADRTLVRTGAPRATIEGCFAVPPDHPARQTLTDAGLDEGGSDVLELVVSRTVEADGGGKARINGRMVTVAFLSQVCGNLVEIAGQHAHQRISDPRHQRAILDLLAGSECVALATEIGLNVTEMRAAELTAAALRDAARERTRELDVLRYEIAEIESLVLQPGEITALRDEAGRLEHAESIATDLSRAIGLLRGEGGIEDLLGEAESAARSAALHDHSAAEPARRLETARLEIADVAMELRGGMVTPDPTALQQARERLDEIARIQRKYGDDEGSIFSYLERARARVAALESEENEATDSGARAERLRSEAVASATELGALRAAAVPAIEKEVVRWLNELALPGARFQVHLAPRDLYEGGLEDVTFLVSTNPGEDPKPVSKVASGGELARIALALQLAGGMQSTTDRPAAMVFDEVDAGVGGEAARSVGRSLAGLARARHIQVIVVTHLPQVAAFADHHLKVVKETSSGRSRALVKVLAGEERVQELSRMLAGMPESGLARDHARELLDIAAADAGVPS